MERTANNPLLVLLTDSVLFKLPLLNAAPKDVAPLKDLLTRFDPRLLISFAAALVLVFKFVFANTTRLLPTNPADWDAALCRVEVFPKPERDTSSS